MKPNGAVSAISILAAADLPMLAEMLARDPSIGMVLSGSKPVDHYVRRVYPSIRVVRVDSQRCRLPARLLLGCWARRRIERRSALDKVYLVAPYYCAAVMAAIGRQRTRTPSTWSFCSRLRGSAGSQEAIDEV